MNRFKTFGLMAILTFLFLFVGGAIAGQGGMIIAAFVTNFVGYYFSDKLVLKAYRAEELPPDHRVVQLVKQLVAKAALPMPKVFIINIG